MVFILRVLKPYYKKVGKCKSNVTSKMEEWEVMHRQEIAQNQIRVQPLEEFKDRDRERAQWKSKISGRQGTCLTLAKLIRFSKSILKEHYLMINIKKFWENTTLGIKMKLLKATK